MDPQSQNSAVSPIINQAPMLPQQAPDKQGLSSLKWVWVIVALLLVLLVGSMFLFSYFSSRHTAYAPTITPTQSGGIPQPKKTTDLAPSLPNSQKTVVIIENSDSSFEKVIMPTAQVSGYIKTIPEGVRVISQSPAGQ